MNKKLILLSVLLLAFAPIKLVKTKVTDNITVSLPKSLTAMTPDDIVQRYPSVRAPLAAFTNEHRTADFSVNTSATQWPDGDIELAKKFFKAGITNLYDRVDFIAEGVHVVNKRKLIYFEFESRVNGNKVKLGETSPVMRYTYIQYLVEKDKALVFSFNCPRDQKAEWQETVRSMMKTVKVK
jgi:hypothetical protein